MRRLTVTLDGNEAAASIAYQLNEVIVIYPITPASPMGEWADQWAAEGRPNLWGSVPTVVEMQSEGGAAGAIHGALQAGSLATTFTASQGLLLMLPNMYKIAGELTSVVFHVAARSLAAQALSIFGDHSAVMAARATGFALLASSSVQEAMDFALIAHAATLEARVPFLHFFDGFRTSHEVMKVEPLASEDLHAMIDRDLVRAHRARALSPELPFIRGTTQNPDVYFQAREAVNPYYLACPTIVQNAMDTFAGLIGRHYHLFDYAGAPDAERVIVLTGSGAETAEETVAYLSARGDKVGVLKVRLYRPFAVESFIAALPATTRSLAVLDRTKEPGCLGEPLYLDVVAAIHEAMATEQAPFAAFPRVIGGRYGLSSKEFTPAIAVDICAPVPSEAPAFVQHVTASIIVGEGDLLPVSALPVDGTYPSATARWEKRNIASEIPVWDADLCIQCGKCVLVCPHAVIRAKVYDPGQLVDAPATFKSTPARWRELSGLRYTLQVAPEDCTGCRLCVEVCPAKSKREVRHKAINMAAQAPIRHQERENWNFFLHLPEIDHAALNWEHVKDVQLLQPLFEFSGACAGCGETPYIKLMSQLFGDRALVANATGCSSIYGGNLPTTPWTINHEGRGPTWSNSLFEDNAEFGLGMRLSLNTQMQYAQQLLRQLSVKLGETLVQALLDADQSSEAGIHAQRQRVQLLKEKLQGLDIPEARDLGSLAETLVKKSVWIIGGDGWGYDIGYGGLDHVLSSGFNVNVLLLDTEVYSNTGGQASKATPRGAVAKFAAQGRMLPKKDLALIAMTYGNIYVARVAMGGSDTQTVKAFLEAEAYDGPSLIIAYSHCIAHGYDLAHGIEQQKAAVLSGYWPLCRYNPDRLKEGKNPLQLDSKPPSLPLENSIYNETRYTETRYTMLAHSRPQEAKRLLELAQDDVRQRWRLYEHWATMPVNDVAQEDNHA